MTNVGIMIFLIGKDLLHISSSFLLKTVLQSRKKIPRNSPQLTSMSLKTFIALLPLYPQKNLCVVHADCGGTTDPGSSWKVAWAFSDKKLSDLCQNHSKKHVENQIHGLRQNNVQAYTFAQFDLLM